LSNADYDVAPGEPDVRGWDVCLANDQKIGKVDDLIIDPSAGKVRYLDVDLDRSTLSLDKNRHVMVPISGAQLDTKDDEVVLSDMSRDALLNLPDYEGKNLPEYEGTNLPGSEGKRSDTTYDQKLHSRLDEGLTTNRMTRSAEELRIGKRMEQKGEVRVSKHIETEHVTQTVPLRGEEVHVERRPVERAVGAAEELRDDEIRVPVMQETTVVEKRPVVKEEIIVSKEPRTTEETVEADVRHEEFDVSSSSDDIRVRDDMRGRGGE
jgi:uncharacterized protein (TIGR02271 family)